MASSTAAAGSQPARPAPRRWGRPLGLASGQLVAAELAAVVAIGAANANLYWKAAAAPVAIALVLLAFGRLRRRWAYEWLTLAARRRSRRRALPVGATPEELLDLVRPGATVVTVELDSIPIGAFADGYGLTAVLELGDGAALLGDPGPLAPSPAALLPPAGPDQPDVRIQLLVSATPAPAPRAGSSPSATSYRQLTEGRIPALQRAFLAVHVRRSGGMAEAELRRALVSAIRRAQRRLDRDGVTGRPLGPESVLRVLAELAYHDPAYPARESWSTVDLGGLRQVTFRLRRWPSAGGEQTRGLLTRLLTLPGTGVTVSVAAERGPGGADEVRGELVVRLAAPRSPAVNAAISALRRQLSSAGAAARRLDATQLEGLAATLPLGGAADPGAAGLVGVMNRTAGAALVGDAGLPADAAALAAIQTAVGGDGLMLGVNRRNEPTTLRLFRPEPTRVALFGGMRCAQLVALRALALGAQVMVQTGRPQAWEPFLRGLGSAGDALVLLAPGRVGEPPPASPLRPQLAVLDTGPVAAMGLTVPEGAWRATLLVRDELTGSDIDALTRADLVLLQPLRPAEAMLAASTLGLGDSAEWLTRIRADMVGVVAHRRTLRWALLATTPIEQQLIGAVTR